MSNVRQFFSPFPPKGPTAAEQVEADRAPVGDIPVVETYGSPNWNPSGGTQTHGVDATVSRQTDPRSFDVHGYDGVVLDPAPVRPEPVLVQVVRDEHEAPEFKAWRTTNMTVNSGRPERIVAQDRARTKVVIRNAGPDVVFIGDTSSVGPYNGFPLAVNSDRELTSTEDVWAISVNTDNTVISSVYLLSEYTVNT